MGLINSENVKGRAVKITDSEVYKSSDGWRFRMLGGNGEKVGWGEAYANEEDAKAAARGLAPDIEPRVVPE